jgi:4'-phosphopantetheinyl transferase
LPEEQERVDRYRFEHLQRRAVVRRGRLRQLVGGYAGIEPSAVRFGYGDKGKPFLKGDPACGAEALQFNLSDSEDLAVFAFARGIEIGADVEMLRSMPDADSIAVSFFADAERDVLADVSAEEKSRAFFNCWTRKEAYIKAIGEGLSEPLDNFCVTLWPTDPCHFLHIGHSTEEAKAWALTHFVPAPESVGAVALRDLGYRISGCFQLID